ncbi:hypothetical protein [Aneurinibacillus tyrosinisolvens]|uniref:hypothetical protein n=1 Tax=Aneurinibacillus tyrosinisolvens TaxID=1443435 RepID=UPI00063FCFC0|nr:hypothetical protein [Aneurinibacillus tyrosinisolvens]
MLTKEKLVNAAKQANENNDHVYIIHSGNGIEVSVKPASTYMQHREEIVANMDILKVMMPDSILKYDFSQWRGHDVSIDILVDAINKEFT